jgi:hypothetical protein
VEQKVHFLGAVKLHCLSLQNHFFPKLFGHSVNPGVLKLFGLQLSDKTNPNFFWFWFWVHISNLFEKVCAVTFS